MSGEQGTRYHCIYDTEASEEGEVVSYSTNEDGTLGRKPVNYDAQIVSVLPTVGRRVGLFALVVASGLLPIPRLAIRSSESRSPRERRSQGLG